MRKVLLLSLAALAAAAVVAVRADRDPPPVEQAGAAGGPTEVATLAGGCFWCVESGLEAVPGVRKVISGYTGGDLPDPSYQQVSAGGTGHVEAVQVHFDPKVVSYTALLEAFWRQIDPTDGGGQFADRGPQYRPVIFYHDQQQRVLAEQSRAQLAASGRFDRPLATEILAAGSFYPAENYHQDYYRKNPLRYKFYRYNSGRDRFLEKHWGDELKVDDGETARNDGRYRKASDEELRKRLTPLQYEVTQREGTERPFDNAYWNEKREGIYVDVVSGEPLFSSLDKYESGTGWPSFTKPLKQEHVVQRTDYKLFLPRTEIRSRYGDSHLGHLFEDGPEPTGLRYCMNSASLRFVAKEQMEEEGYGEFLSLFE